MDLVQLKIQKDKNTVKYISLIRKFDKSLSMVEIKKNIENGDFAVEFDLEYYDVVEDLEGIDRKILFRRLISDLITLGANIDIYHNSSSVSLTFLDNWLSTLQQISDEVESDIDNETGEE